MSLKIIPGTGRKETKGIPVPNYIALSLVQYQDNFSVLIVTFFNLGLDIQITEIPNCRLQSFFFPFFATPKSLASSLDKIRSLWIGRGKSQEISYLNFLW